MKTLTPTIITLDQVTAEYSTPHPKDEQPTPDAQDITFRNLPPLSTPQQKEQAKAKLHAFLILSKPSQQ